MEKRSVPLEAGRKNSEPVLPIAQWHLGNLVLQRVFAESKKLNFCFPAMKKNPNSMARIIEKMGQRGKRIKCLRIKAIPLLFFLHISPFPHYYSYEGVYGNQGCNGEKDFVKMVA